MSDAPSKKRPKAKPRETNGILASLPNTRPQRPSARRAPGGAAKPVPIRGASATKASKAKVSAKRPSAASARAKTPPAKAPPVKARPAKAPPVKAPTVKAPKQADATPTARPATKRAGAYATKVSPKRVPVPVPRQGFEAGSELEQGVAVGPPSSIELAGSVVGLLGEAAQAGMSSGGRLLVGTLARLRGR